MKDIQILVATHKKYKMPESDIYLPIHVGREGKEDLGYQGDNEGDNISLKNVNYCELTALYWAWKNLKCDYVGLNHYRRYFTRNGFIKKYILLQPKKNLILEKKELEKLLVDYDLILPKKRNYYIESIRTHYKNAHFIKDLNEVEKIIIEKYPTYHSNFDQVMNQSKLHLYNMFVMSKDNFNEYADWLFDILFELEKRIDISGYDDYQKRIYGFLSERLFNVWINHKNLRCAELEVVNLEGVNWYKKANEFLKRKFKSPKEVAN